MTEELTLPVFEGPYVVEQARDQVYSFAEVVGVGRQRGRRLFLFANPVLNIPTNPTATGSLTVAHPSARADDGARSILAMLTLRGSRLIHTGEGLSEFSAWLGGWPEFYPPGTAPEPVDGRMPASPPVITFKRGLKPIQELSISVYHAVDAEGLEELRDHWDTLMFEQDR